MLHLSGNKMQKTANFVWSELKHLFTYSPIHLFTYSPIHLFTFTIPLGDLGAQNQNGAQTPHFHQNWAYATNPAEPPPRFADMLIHHPLEIKCKNVELSLVGVKTTIHLFTYSLFYFLPPIPWVRRLEPKLRKKPSYPPELGVCD